VSHDWDFKGPTGIAGLYRYKCLNCGCKVDSSVRPDHNMLTILEIPSWNGYARRAYPSLTCDQAVSIKIHEE
jgi:hypothetical protein